MLHLPLMDVIDVVRRNRSGPDTDPPTLLSAEVGNVSNQTMVGTFSEGINSDTADYITGFTFQINAVTETLNTGVKDGNTITWTFTEIVDASDTLTLAYAQPPGDIEDLSDNLMVSFGATGVTNNTGSVAGYLFNNKANSHWLAAG